MRFLILIAMLVLASAAQAETTAGLSPADKASLIEAAELIEENGQYFVMACDEKNPVEIIIEDLNGDEQPEVFPLTQGMCLGGHAYAALSLYIKDAKGAWVHNLGFPSNGYKKLETSNLGFRDIEIGGPGMCFPVWRWNGKIYDIYKRCPL